MVKVPRVPSFPEEAVIEEIYKQLLTVITGASADSLNKEKLKIYSEMVWNNLLVNN